MDTLFNSCYYDIFYPQIIPYYYDTAYINEPYEFLVEVDTFNVDSMKFVVEYIAEDFSFDENNGIISGLPAELGSFPCIITVVNYDMYGIATDVIDNVITVVNPTYFREQVSHFSISAIPNPFSTSTSIEYTLNSPQTVTITFYDSYGRTVDRITQHQQQGLQKVVWMPAGLNEGIYYFRIEAGNQQTSRKVILMW